MLEGYEQVCDGVACLVLGSRDVKSGLEGLAAHKGKDVRKVGQILKRIADFGTHHLQNKEQLRLEGRFPNGKKDGGRVAVWAVKSHQVRVYGGTVNIKGRAVFLCVEHAQKKTDKADQKQLERVARVLGEFDGHV